jgi:hypothetical protein
MRLGFGGYANFLKSGAEFGTTVGKITDERFDRAMEVI